MRLSSWTSRRQHEFAHTTCRWLTTSFPPAAFCFTILPDIQHFHRLHAKTFRDAVPSRPKAAMSHHDFSFGIVAEHTLRCACIANTAEHSSGDSFEAADFEPVKEQEQEKNHE